MCVLTLESACTRAVCTSVSPIASGDSGVSAHRIKYLTPMSEERLVLDYDMLLSCFVVQVYALRRRSHKLERERERAPMCAAPSTFVTVNMED